MWKSLHAAGNRVELGGPAREWMCWPANAAARASYHGLMTVPTESESDAKPAQIAPPACFVAPRLPSPGERPIPPKGASRTGIQRKPRPAISQIIHVTAA